MGFLYPSALLLFALTPLLLLAYLIHERPHRVRVSSVLAYRALHLKTGRFGRRPKLDWLFFLELLILCLAVLAMAGPYVVRHGMEIAVVLDNSAAMQAQLPGGSTRFKRAIAKLDDALRAQGGTDRVTVYLTAPQPHQLAPPYRSPGAARAAIAQAGTIDASADLGSLRGLLGNLAANARFEAVGYAGSYPVVEPVPARLRAYVFDAPIPNYALSSFTLRREAFGSAALHARVGVANFSTKPQTVTVTVSGGGKTLARAQTNLAAQGVGALDFPALKLADVYRADLQPADGFPLDNTAYATAAAVKSIAVLFVSPSPTDANGLGALPGVAVTARTPATYTPADLARADVAIFEYSVPKELPTVNTLLVMPPPDDPLFDFAITPAPTLAVTGWHPTDPLTDGVNFRLLNFRQGEFFGVHPWMQAVASGSGGGILLRGVRQGHRFVATGFNLFPYLGRRNLPMSILTLNLLSYLAGLGSDSAGYRTGKGWPVPAGINAIVLPSGRKVAVKPATMFTGDVRQGIYTLAGAAGAKHLRAVNLNDLTVSDLSHPPALKIEAGGETGAAPAVAMTKSYRGWLLAAVLALAVLEGLLVYRRRRAPVEA